MVEYTKDVADRVLRILQASGQISEDKMTEVMVRADHVRRAPSAY